MTCGLNKSKVEKRELEEGRLSLGKETFTLNYLAED